MNQSSFSLAAGDSCSQFLIPTAYHLFPPTYNPSTNHMTLIGSNTPTYDSNGNVTNDFLNSYAWDANDRPVTVNGVGVTYDALGRMVEQNRSGTYTQIEYSPTGFKMQLLNGQNPVTQFLPMPGGTAEVWPATGPHAYYRHSDWLGSSRLASTNTRTVYYDGAYGPFGEQYANTGTTDLSFTGMNQDTSPNVYDFPAREYGIQGRWPSPDPAGLAAVDASDAQTWNRYAYVRNSPLNLIDLLGLKENNSNPCFWADFPDPFGNEWEWQVNDDDNGVDPCQGGGGRSPSSGAPSGGGGGGPLLNPPKSTPPAPVKCAKPNWLNKLEIPVLQDAAALSGETIGIGLNGSAGAGSDGLIKGWGVAGQASGYLVASPNGQAAFVFTYGTTPLFGPVKGAGVLGGASFLQSEASSPDQLGGLGVDGGATAAAGIGAAVDFSYGSGGFTTTTTLGFGAGGEGHAAVVTNTVVIPVCQE